MDGTTNFRPLAVDLNGAARLVSLSKPTLRLYIRKGRLRATKCGKKVLIPMSELERLVMQGAPS
jgi:excisionase family DNA binding protein